MTTEKLQLLAISALPSPEKKNILQIWNKLKQARLALRYPIGPFSGAIFLVYLHKYVFWHQLTKHALDLMPVFLDAVQKVNAFLVYPLRSILTRIGARNGTMCLLTRSRTRRLINPTNGMPRRSPLVWILCII